MESDLPSVKGSSKRLLIIIVVAVVVVLLLALLFWVFYSDRFGTDEGNGSDSGSGSQQGGDSGTTDGSDTGSSDSGGSDDGSSDGSGTGGPVVEGSFVDDFEESIEENPYIDQSSVENIEWDGSSALRRSQGQGDSEEISPDLDGLVGLYHFSSGALLQDTAGSNDGSCDSCPVESNAGLIGGAADFDGSGNHVAVDTSSLSVDAGSVLAWGRPSGFGAVNYFFGHTTEPAFENRIQLYAESGALSVGLGDEHRVADQVSNLQEGSWLHAALTWDSGSWALYHNGAEAASGTYQGLTALQSTADIGNNGDSASRDEAWPGLLEEVAVFDRALSPQEIEDIYNLIAIQTIATISSFKSEPIDADETFYALTASWQSEGGSVAMEVSIDGGDNWCSVSNGGNLGGACSPYDGADSFKYKAELISGALLDSVEFTWETTQPPEPQGSGDATEPTEQNLKVAFIGDQGLGSDSEAVLQLIKDEGADAVLHQGDFDYEDDPQAWEGQINSVLGSDFPYFSDVGNHDEDEWGAYQALIEARIDNIDGASCSGDIGVLSECTFKGLKFLLTGPDTLYLGTDDEDLVNYIDTELGDDDHIWRVCSWHKNQEAMQVGGKGDEVGWLPYESCRENGAIIATGHEHSYSRTKALTSMENQEIHADWDVQDAVMTWPGTTFAFVSGIAGRGIRDQERCLPEDYPYGCNGEWASIYTSNQGAQFGALFVEFYVDGDERKAMGYFKDIDGNVIDEFEIISNN